MQTERFLSHTLFILPAVDFQGLGTPARSSSSPSKSSRRRRLLSPSKSSRPASLSIWFLTKFNKYELQELLAMKCHRTCRIIFEILTFGSLHAIISEQSSLRANRTFSPVFIMLPKDVQQWILLCQFHLGVCVSRRVHWGEAIYLWTCKSKSLTLLYNTGAICACIVQYNDILSFTHRARICLSGILKGSSSYVISHISDIHT